MNLIGGALARGEETAHLNSSRAARHPTRGWRALTLVVFLLGSTFACGSAEQPARRQRGPVAHTRSLPKTEMVVPTEPVPWQLTNPAELHEIEGYASAVSVNRGDPIDLFVSTSSAEYSLELYRMGWYGGAGAILVLGPLNEQGISQQTPMPDSDGRIDCNWENPVTIQTDPDWDSGVYLAKLTTVPDGKERYVVFVVRDDESHAPILLQTAVTTYQAYNDWGGRSLYSVPNAAAKVSFNRPYDDGRYGDGGGAGDFLFWEYPMIRWLEREGYDVVYSTDIDTHRDGRPLRRHKVFMTAGHDEYWTLEQRQHVEAARDAGVSLAFFSANDCYWQIRLEPDANENPDRTEVCYKLNAKTNDPAAQDPKQYPTITTEFRLTHGNLPGQPEMGLMGVESWYGRPKDETGDWMVYNPTSWVFDGTGVKKGDTLPGLLGYEVDAVWSPGPPIDLMVQKVDPPGTTLLAHSPFPYQHTDMSISTEYSDSVVFDAQSGAIVFATGTIQWSWALDDFGHNYPSKPNLSKVAQKISMNVLDQMIAGQ